MAASMYQRDPRAVSCLARSTMSMIRLASLLMSLMLLQGLFLGGSRTSGAEIRDQNGEYEAASHLATGLRLAPRWPIGRRKPVRADDLCSHGVSDRFEHPQIIPRTCRVRDVQDD
jgi:hypothetical protein